MVMGRMVASGILPYNTFLATVDKIPNLGDNIFPTRLLVPSIKNYK